MHGEFVYLKAAVVLAESVWAALHDGVAESCVN